MSEEYPLSIFDLEEGKEYRSIKHGARVYRIKSKKLEQRDDRLVNKHWEESSARVNDRFKEIKPKKKLIMYIHYYQQMHAGLVQEFKCAITPKTWDQYNSFELKSIPVDFIDTEILKEIEVDE